MTTWSPVKSILIAGPTASGKSALAIELARRFDGVIVNADSMQVYRELRILTARPSGEDERAVPHLLYGHVSGSTAYSTGDWILDVGRALAEIRERGKRPILVGGTGLYFKALLEGLSPIPSVPEDIRAHWRLEAKRIGAAGLHELLLTRDPLMASRLHASDTQRITRAHEVLSATGRSLADWQELPREPVLEEAATIRLAVLPGRLELNRRCDARFDRMMAEGALEEVRALKALGLSPELPVMKALGVPPLISHLDGQLGLDAAVASAKSQTRDYVKRQLTWLRRNMCSWFSLLSQDYVVLRTNAFDFVLETIDQP